MTTIDTYTLGDVDTLLEEWARHVGGNATYVGMPRTSPLYAIMKEGPGASSGYTPGDGFLPADVGRVEGIILRMEHKQRKVVFYQYLSNHPMRFILHKLGMEQIDYLSTLDEVRVHIRDQLNVNDIPKTT